VNKITDASNNAINYIYNEDKARGEYILQRINYGNNSVRLTYADRNDTHTSYLAGSKLQQTKRAFGFSCPMITREFNSTKGLNLSAVF
jgi:hypothetical protein